MVAGGRSSLLHVWDLSSQSLLHAIQLPERVRVVRQLLFLSRGYDGGSSQVSSPLSLSLSFSLSHSLTHAYIVHCHSRSKGCSLPPDPGGVGSGWGSAVARHRVLPAPHADRVT